MNDDNNNNNSNPESEASHEDAPMTAKQFNQALSARERAFEKRMLKMQEDYNALLSKFAPKQEEPQLSQTAELKRTVAELQKHLNEQNAREKERKLREVAGNQLKQHGISNEFVDHALAYLVDAKKAVKYDSEGQLVFSIDNVDYSLEDGVQLWAQSKDAKLYRAPTQAQGSGSTNFSSLQKGNNSSIQLKFDERKINQFTPQNSSSTLDRNSKEQLSQLLAAKLLNRQ